MAVAAAAFLLAATAARASVPVGAWYSPAVWTIIRAYFMLGMMVVIGGGLLGAGMLYGYLCRKTKHRLFRAEGLRFALLRFACFFGMATVIGMMLALVLDATRWSALKHILWIYTRLSGDNSFP